MTESPSPLAWHRLVAELATLRAVSPPNITPGIGDHYYDVSAARLWIYTKDGWTIMVQG